MCHRGHCDPIMESCPAECLASVVSMMALNRVLRGYADRSYTPQTIGDVVRLAREGKLTSQNFEGLGSRRAAEIETGLVFAGFAVGPVNMKGGSGHGLPER